MGDLIQKVDGTHGVVQFNTTEYRTQTMYNLTVAEAHTFYVGGGDWLVHNCPAVDGGKANGYVSKLEPGPYAKESIPARGPGRDFTVSERYQINEIGNKYGCHTCGRKDPGTKSGNFILDHQPPSALNDTNAPQRLYPHCKYCSRSQGGQVTQAKRRGNQ